MNILCVHQGSELYGSDKTFVQSVQAFRAKYPDSYIEIILPNDGPLVSRLVGYADTISYDPIWILRKSNISKLIGFEFFNLVSSSFLAWRMMRRFDKTYINTVVVLNFIIASMFSTSNRVIHVHEIPTGILRYVFSLILALSRAPLIFNSSTTRNHFLLPFWQRKTTVLNGVEPVLDGFAGKLAASGKLKLLMIGRINDWKGQDLLLVAMGRMSKEILSSIELRIVGDVYSGQDHIKESLVIHVAAADKLNSVVTFEGFSSSPGEHYDWCDVVVVPSKKPEPFGLVAVEAMAYGKCVVAARHGGLTEIVEDGKTGFLFSPNDSEDLAGVIEMLLRNSGRVIDLGLNGRSRFMEKFTEAEYIKNLSSAIE
jgi:glycosyltransferase involved in cell wall biosynthesis